ncbi:hypothetical protein FQR65_LT03910 [Abscondita terminalis]|nr:hypothetical protein FQR65_LT03910 [Abscondita terminalis]
MVKVVVPEGTVQKCQYPVVKEPSSNVAQFFVPWTSCRARLYTPTSSPAVTVLFVHWSACYIYIAPSSDSTSPKTWIYRAEIEPERHNVTMLKRYFECLLSAFCHFFGTGYGQYEIINYDRALVFSAVCIIGMFYSACITAIVLQLIIDSSSSISKCNELLSQLRTYIRKHNLPLGIQKKLVMFFEHRYQNNYYKETAILNTLSEHLRLEIYLCRAKAFVEKVDLLKHVPSTTVGLLLCYMKPEIFLPNDLIWKTDVDEAVYFISYGTVSVILSSGEEFQHYEDGDIIGLTRMFHVHQVIKSCLVVATEITELFKIEKKDLQYCFSKDENLFKLFKKTAYQRYNELISFKKKQDSNDDVVDQLRRGDILEHSYKMRTRKNNTLSIF